MKKILVLCLFLFICLNFIEPNIKNIDSDWDDLYLFKKIYTGVKKFYSSLLWVRMDEFYHIKKGFNKDEKKQLNILKAINRLSPDNHIAAIFLSYMYSRVDKDYKKALWVLNGFIKENPKHKYLHKILGEIAFIDLIYLKDYKSAENALNVAVKLSINSKEQKNDPVQYLFYGNYLRMLRTVYQRTDNKVKFDQMDSIIKDLKKRFAFEDEDFVDKHPIYSKALEDQSIIHNHAHDHNNHEHEHFEERFLFQKKYIKAHFYVLILLCVLCFYVNRNKNRIISL